MNEKILVVDDEKEIADLLEVYLKNDNYIVHKVVSTEELFENIWKEKYLDNNNTVMAHIGRLREKLNEPAKNPKFIKTVWGVGYEIE